MDEREREALASRVLELAGAHSEAIAVDTDLGLTRFTHNAIHQNLGERDTRVRLRTIVDGRTGVATTSDLGDAGLRALVIRAREIAALAPVDAEAPGLRKHPRCMAPQGAFDGNAAAATPARRAAIAAEVFSVAQNAGMWAAGYVSTQCRGTTVANTLGTLSSYDGTTVGVCVKANAVDSTGYAEYFANALADLDGMTVARIAVEKARAGAAPRAVDPGSWTVVLEPAAVGELVSYLANHFSAQAYDEGSSFLSDGLGRSYASEAVTIADDFMHPLHAGMPFDYEGSPTRTIVLMERGVARAVVTDATWAQRLQMPDTGHAEPAPSADGPQPRHLVVASGTDSLQHLIAGTKRGLLVSRFWYIRPVDRRRTIVTGMTRDGTFLIENGVVGAGVRNLRFNQNILEALSHADFGFPQTRSDGYAYTVVVPPLRIQNFQFTSVTAF